MSVTAQERLVTHTAVVSPEADSHHRAQGWFIVIGASALLWTGIIVAIVGITDLVL